MFKKVVGLFSVLSLILAICSCAPVTVNTAPPGAAVFSADGQIQLGSTPYNTSVFVGDKDLIIRKARYYDENVKLGFDSPRNVDLTLRATPVLINSNPEAEIYPSGSDAAIGHTPMEVAVSDKDSIYTLKAKGYRDQDITIGPDTVSPLDVQLERRPIVTISAKQSPAKVFENEKLIGKAPVQEEILTSRTFEVRKENYFPKTVTLTGAPPYEVVVNLKPFPIVNVSVTPEGAHIYSGKKLVGKTSVKLAVGKKAILTVRAPRYYPQKVVLTPDSPAQTNIVLKAMPYVMINSEPVGAEVFIDGKSIGMAPVEQLIEKDTVVELRKNGFVTKTATLTGADKEVTIKLEKVPAPVVEKAPAPAVAEKPAVAKAPAAAPAPKRLTFWQKILKFFGK